jgi:hypothetical protein
MMKHLRYLAVAALATVGVACSEAPTDVNEEFEGELVITEGVAAPEYVARVRPVFSEVASASASLGGSVSSPLELKPQSCEPSGRELTVTYSITGRQVNPASFQVNTRWQFNGSTWDPSQPMTVNVAPRAATDAPTVKQVAITVVNASSVSVGSSSFVISPFGLVTTAPAALSLTNADAHPNATVNVSFVACPVVNTAPVLVLPADFSVEATSSAGAAVDYSAMVSASDAQDGDLTSSVVCAPASNSIFALGTTAVNCSVTDAGGISASGTFVITVEDTTPAYFTSFPAGTINLIAADINGAVLDIDGLNITVADVGNVSEPSTFSCDYVAGTKLAIGSTTSVYCTATDAIGNESDASSFDVYVGLNVNTTGFLPPLRMVAPFSAHKRGSTIPHKFLPPTYADGTPAMDLASGLGLTLRRIDGIVEADAVDGTEYAAGSTVWRYDAESGHYIFNLKTGTSSPWEPGTWITTASYAGITLATTQFDLKR